MNTETIRQSLRLTSGEAVAKEVDLAAANVILGLLATATTPGARTAALILADATLSEHGPSGVALLVKGQHHA